jgi:hypothetical protein
LQTNNFDIENSLCHSNITTIEYPNRFWRVIEIAHECSFTFRCDENHLFQWKHSQYAISTIAHTYRGCCFGIIFENNIFAISEGGFRISESWDSMKSERCFPKNGFYLLMHLGCKTLPIFT